MVRAIGCKWKWLLLAGLLAGWPGDAVRSEDRKAAKDSAEIVLAAGEAEDPAAKKDELVTIKAFMATDRLPAGGKCRVAMVVNIKDGWHINTNPAKPTGFVATLFTVKSKQGTVLKDVRYPEGKKLPAKDASEQQTVYENQVTLYGVLEIPKDAAGEMEELDLMVKYQACDKDVCHPPKTIKLSGKIPVAPPGEAVKPINAKYFQN